MLRRELVLGTSDTLLMLWSLHVKDKPGGGIAEKLMSYVWGFVWRSSLHNHASLTTSWATSCDCYCSG